jgi:hypothetical protein
VSLEGARPETGTAEGTATEAAGRIASACRAAPRRSSCYDAALGEMARDDVRAALAALEALSVLDPSVVSDGHMYVHAIGISAYDPERDFGELFRSCTELFHAGCYHGLIQARFADEGEITKEVVSSLCTEVVPDRATDRWTYFQCLHGLGHGLVIHADHDLVEGLAGCDLLDSDWDNTSCQGGAFMENVTNATHPHHAALTASLGDAGGMDHGAHGGAADHGTHGDHGAHGDHGVQGDHEADGDSEVQATEEPFKAIDPADPHYPCSIVEPHQKASCYEMQTSVILHLNGYDFAGAAETCDGAEKPWRAICHRSLGRDASGFASRNVARVIDLCDKDRSEYAPYCYVGATKAAIDWSGEPRDGIVLCSRVKGEESRLLCFEAVGEQIGMITPGRKPGERICAAMTGREEQACLYGARLLSERPEFLSSPGSAF